MPIFMDRHKIQGATAVALAEAHSKDVAIQDQYGVKFLTYWFDEGRGNAFCLIDAPDAATAMHVHATAHGELALDVIPVDLSAVEAFLGRISDAAPAPGRPSVDAGLRAVMFTDIVESTAMTERLGDARALEMIRSHDSLTRRALVEHAGREVKHTGDGIMASFESIPSSVACGCAIQRAFVEFNRASTQALQVRIGIHMGEPVEEHNDLFGATVQIAARVCEAAAPETVVVSGAVRDSIGGQFAFGELGHFHLKGVAAPVALYRVEWRQPSAVVPA
jgi:class 3 adenylate cyclase